MIPNTEIRTAAAYMLAVLRDDVICTTEVAGVLAQTVRTGTGYTLTLDGNGPLSAETLQAWAGAVGQPGATWTMYRGGTQAAIVWEVGE